MSYYQPMDKEQVRQSFEHFAERQTPLSSPLYEKTAWGIVGDAALLELASCAGPGQPPPHLFFAAVQYLLLKGSEDEPLRRCYPGLTEEPREQNPFPLFQSFCRHNYEAIRHLLETRIVQTNEVRRSSAIVPGVAVISGESGEIVPLSWIEIGASAGLNLLWDRFFFRYGDAMTWGDTGARVRIACALRGELRPPLPPYPLPLRFRAGVDRNPLDVTDPDTVLWLRALIWPEQSDRIRLLSAAIEEAQCHPPPLMKGDALALLPDVIALAPMESHLCLFHSYTIYQFTPAMRRELDNLLREASRTRPIYRLGLEGEGSWPVLKLLAYRNGEREDRVLCHHEAHGLWMEWQE